MILFFLIAVLSFVAQLFLPWWSMVIIAFVSSFFFGRNLRQSFFLPFLACGIVWLLMAATIHFTRGDLMTGRISQLLSLASPILIYLMTFLIAAIAGGVAGFAGYSLKILTRSSTQARTDVEKNF